MAWLKSVTGSYQTALVAIDAPLVVPNIDGAREGDKLLTKVFRVYQAGTHPASRTNLGRYGQPPGDIRGETLAARMEAELNFRQNPYIETKAKGRYLFECYPHPAMVVLFGLTTTLKYKRKLKSIANDRFAAYAALQNYLRELAQANPPMFIPLDLLARDTSQLRGRALKHYEDLLDAIVCAYVAFYYWWWGPERTYVFGSLDKGYIVAPITPELRLTIND
jgi:predicted RNase H-like nuclease